MQVFTAPPGSTLAPELRARIAASATQFEAMAIGQLLEPMFATVDGSKGPFGGGDAEKTWRPMMVTELAKGIAAHGGLGFARPVMEQMMRLQEAKR